MNKPQIRIENNELSPEVFEEFIRGVKVTYGSQSKCRHCKKITEEVVVLKFNGGDFVPEKQRGYEPLKGEAQ